jgi:hypothetical protein
MTRQNAERPPLFFFQLHQLKETREHHARQTAAPRPELHQRRRELASLLLPLPRSIAPGTAHLGPTRSTRCNGWPAQSGHRLDQPQDAELLLRSGRAGNGSVLTIIIMARFVSET